MFSGAKRYDRSRWKLEYPFVDRMRVRNVAETQVSSERLPVDISAPTGMRGKRLELRAEYQRAADVPIVERLLADAIAGERELAPFPIPQPHRKHAHGTLQRAHHSSSGNGLEKNFGVGMAAPRRKRPVRMRFVFEIAAQVPVVVYLAVECRDVAPVVRAHRLVTRGRQIDDRQATMPERDTATGIDPAPVIVWTAVRDCGRLGEYRRGQIVGRLRRRRQHESRDSTHSFLVAWSQRSSMAFCARGWRSGAPFCASVS